MGEKTFVTDLNARERERYARAFESIEKAARDSKEALENQDDKALMIGVMMVGLTWSGIGKDMLDILKTGVSTEIPDAPTKAIGT